MSFTDVFPLAGIGKVDQSFSQLDLNAKSQLLRESSKAPPEALHQIDSHLNAMRKNRI